MKEFAKVLQKAIFPAMAALLFAAALMGCAKKEAAAAAGPEKFKVGYIVAGFDDIWHNLTATSTKKYIESQDPNIVVDLFDGKSKSEVAMNILETISNSNYNFIIMAAGDVDLSEQILYLKKQNIPFIGYALEREGTKDLYSTFVCNDFDLGRVTAERAAAELPQGARIVYLDGPVYSGTILRRQGLQEGLLSKRPDVVLLDEQIASFTKSEAMEKMDDWIQRFGKVDGVLAANDAMALGAIESLRANGYDIANTYVYGIDSVPEACLAIQAGELRFSSFQDPMSYAKAFYARIKDFKDKKIDASFTQNVYIEADYTDASNVEQRISFYREAGAIK
jgi:ABC-type sugar transport system substrate-binding protein